MHWGLFGMSGSGKSRAAKEFIIPGLRRAGVKVAVLDPLLAGISIEARSHAVRAWGADFITGDAGEFMRVVKSSRKIAVVIDETAQATADHATRIELEWCATIGRNFGILSYWLAQRSMMVHPNIRGQMSNFLVFQQKAADCQVIYDLTNCADVLRATDLPKGVAMLVKPYERAQMIRVFDPEKDAKALKKPM